MKFPGLSDAEIWELFKKGDKRAIAHIYSLYSENVYLYGLKITSNHVLVEDVIQDMYVHLIQNRKKLGDTDNILFYLLKIFKNRLLRKLQGEQRFVNEAINDYSFDVTWSVEHNIILEEDSEQKLKMVQDALLGLTPRQKEAIYLRFTRELKYSEVAEIMDISVEACRNLISKAIKGLKSSVSEKENNLMALFALIVKHV
ncbi:RNA polymerase sigma factor, sigma-70 family [Mariniphaga anaerophila]|uniref:RNA polymerase sigma factor, sigma-70 family n=1 Tax=Mariniphaga anaerophila TaxID=1484053 RepID=A0A1M4W2H5_9BACT|nr:sigma-70 family RNA polymerase sigma factor [Mariniphaga anaerophila]SHE75484.1 RNA polymerase sigma factor, sigma-70 family [Mariniphaga anaerophila]